MKTIELICVCGGTRIIELENRGCDHYEAKVTCTNDCAGLTVIARKAGPWATVIEAMRAYQKADEVMVL